MLTIRLSRVGKKNKPMYRLVIAEKARDPYGKALEILGSYNPYTKDLQAKNERIKYWLSKGSQMSPSVNNLLIEKGVIEGEKVKASKAKKKKKSEKEGEKGASAEEKKNEGKKEAKESETPKEGNAPADKEASSIDSTSSEQEKTEEKLKETKEEPKKE